MTKLFFLKICKTFFSDLKTRITHTLHTLANFVDRTNHHWRCELVANVVRVIDSVYEDVPEGSGGG